MAKLATLECTTCAALLEVYPRDVSDEPGVGWTTVDEECCKAAPVRRCPHALAEIKRRFPELYR
jgi:hypothetical protein